MSAALKKEFEFYLSHQDEFVQNYDGSVIVIKDRNVIGVYDSELSAVVEAEKDHELGTFLVQRVSEGNEAYAVTIHSPGIAFP